MYERIDRANLLALDEVFKNTRQGVIGQSSAVLFMAFILKDFVATNIVLLWLCAQLCNFMVRILIIAKYRKVRSSIHSFAQAKCWLKYYMVSMLITSTLWGLSSFFIEDISHDYHFLMYAVLVGLSFASISTLGFVLEIYMAYVIPMLGLLFYSFITYDDIIGQIAGIFILISYGYAHMSVVQFSNNFKEAQIDKELALEAQNDLKEQAKKLEYMAHHDSLTGLANRASFHQRLAHAIAQSQRAQNSMALFFLDIDKFKEINDNFGHEIGDLILKAFTNRLENSIRQDDTLARLGGDEFTIIMQNIEDDTDVEKLAQKIIDAFATPIRIKESAIHITTSIGVSIYPQSAQSPKELLLLADEAMYMAKKEGRNRYRVHL